MVSFAFSICSKDFVSANENLKSTILPVIEWIKISLHFQAVTIQSNGTNCYAMILKEFSDILFCELYRVVSYVDLVFRPGKIRNCMRSGNKWHLTPRLEGKIQQLINGKEASWISPQKIMMISAEHSSTLWCLPFFSWAWRPTSPSRRRSSPPFAAPTSKTWRRSISISLRKGLWWG